MVGQHRVMAHNTQPSIPRESGSLSRCRTSFPSQGSGSRAPSPAVHGAVPLVKAVSSGSQSEPMIARVPRQGCRVPLTSSGGDFTACWLSERRRAPFTRRRNICRMGSAQPRGPSVSLGLEPALGCWPHPEGSTQDPVQALGSHRARLGSHSRAIIQPQPSPCGCCLQIFSPSAHPPWTASRCSA